MKKFVLLSLLAAYVFATAINPTNQRKKSLKRLMAKNWFSAKNLITPESPILQFGTTSRVLNVIMNCNGISPIMPIVAVVDC